MNYVWVIKCQDANYEDISNDICIHKTKKGAIEKFNKIQKSVNDQWEVIPDRLIDEDFDSNGDPSHFIVHDKDYNNYFAIYLVKEELKD